MKYSHDASGNLRSVLSDDLSLPKISSQPTAQVVVPGDTVTFSVTIVDARAVNFQWKFNGADIPAATGDSLLLTDVRTANEGLYSVVVTNGAGSVTSALAALMLDSDRDGLPDSWEIANFGNATRQRGGDNLDGDGMSNLDELLDGTDPTDKGSMRPRLIAHSGTGGSVKVTPMKLSYDFGETVTLTPIPDRLSVFVGWAGDLNGAADPATLAMDGNKAVRGKFASTMFPPGLIALWRGETDATDLIGGHDGTFFAGTVVTAPSVTAFGKVGGAFKFDGTVHVRVPDSAELKPARLTMEMWVFPSAPIGNFQTIIARGSSTDDNDTWALGVANNKPQFWSHGFRLLEGPSAIPLNEWTHLASTYDGSFKRLYVNGVQVAAREELGTLMYDPAPVPVTIGSDWTSNATNARFSGRIDEVALYGRALTADEILGIARAGGVEKTLSQPYFTSPERLPSGALGVQYALQLTTIRGALPVMFSLSRGGLPPGMTLSLVGMVSGSSTAAGIYDFSVMVRDAAGKTNEQDCVLEVV